MEIDFGTQGLTWVIFGITLFIISLVTSFIILFRIYRKRLIDQFKLANQKEVSHKNKLIEAQIISKDNERKRIASEIHDDISSRLAILKMLINSLAAKNTISEKQYKKLKENVEIIIKASQNISHGLMPPELEHAGLEEALESLIALINQSNENLKIELLISNPLPSERNVNVEISIYRIIFELLHNTIKHAKASIVRINIRNEEDNELFINYEDNGIGFNFDDTKKYGLGLSNIRSRCLYIGAKINLTSSLNNGFNANFHVKY